ncbi:hypothetical protein B0H34DRAFT_514162 [Crassisporium funariophilum]|nr:hypothetical protein B0H34DRAFT_514162 [Crassisporium funariophilum]
MNILASVNWNSPLSLYSIPVVWFTSFYPSLWKFMTIDNSVGYNNVQPRSNTARMATEKSISPAMAARIQRMEGAHLNGNEAMPLWFAAVLAGNYTGLDNHWMNTMSAAYVVTRILFNQVYVNHNHAAKGWLRSFLYFLGLGKEFKGLEGGICLICLTTAIRSVPLDSPVPSSSQNPRVICTFEGCNRLVPFVLYSLQVKSYNSLVFLVFLWV